MPWNHKMVQSLYPSIGYGFLHEIGDRININPPVVAMEIRRLVKTENTDPNSDAVLARAREATKDLQGRRLPYMSPVFGYVAQWLSEIAGPEKLEKLLRHADTYLSPSWSNGGLYYKRCDKCWDEDGNYTYVDPYTGNVGIAYSRLNVLNGQKKMWDAPWTREEVECRPWIDGIGYEQDIDCLRGQWSEKHKTMIATFKTWNGSQAFCRPVFKKLPHGKYGVYVGSKLKSVTTVEKANEDITVEVLVGAEDLDIIIVRA